MDWIDQIVTLCSNGGEDSPIEPINRERVSEMEMMRVTASKHVDRCDHGSVNDGFIDAQFDAVGCGSTSMIQSALHSGSFGKRDCWVFELGSDQRVVEMS
ncbi:hypothetical protein CsSME_00027684 [Camellia sinensis var. sinensis]